LARLKPCSDGGEKQVPLEDRDKRDDRSWTNHGERKAQKRPQGCADSAAALQGRAKKPVKLGAGTAVLCPYKV
jgi:hypothetical protein